MTHRITLLDDLLEKILLNDINEKSSKLSVISNFLMVPKEGLEPTHPCEYQILSLTRLPVSPLRLVNCLIKHKINCFEFNLISTMLV